MKENFDDIIRRRWEEQQFPIDDAHRQAMERLLEGDKKRRGFIFWWIGGLAVTLLIGYGMWKYSAPQAQEKSRTEDTEKEITGNEISKAEAKAEAQAKAKAKEEAQANEISLAKSETEKANQLEILKAVKSTKDQSQSKSGKQDKLNHQADQQNKPRLPVAMSESIPRTENAENTDKANTNKESLLDPLKVVGRQPVTKNVEPGVPAENKAPAEGYKVELENPNQVSILSNEASIQVFPDSIEYDPWTNAIYHNGTVRSLNKTMPLDALAINNVESLKKITPGTITPHTKVTRPVYFIAETGLGMVLASKPYYDGGLKFNVGGGLGMKLIPRVHLQLTGGYLMQDGGFDFERTSTVNTLSFGVRSQFNTLQPDRLHFVYGKLGAAYRFQRSTLDVHMGVQWLYGAQGNITMIQQSQFPPNPPEQTNYAWLNTTGLRKTIWWSDVSYGYMLLPKLYLHGGVTFYYSSLTEENNPVDGYDWNGKTASVQPFITLNYLLHANF